MDSVGAETLRVHAVVATPQGVEMGLLAGDASPRPELGSLPVGHHLKVLQAVPAARDGRAAEPFGNPLAGVDDRGGGGGAVCGESGGNARLGAGVQMGDDGL